MSVTLANRGFWDAPSFLCAPSLRNRKFACGWYGVGHTARRHPGEMRGTVIGRRGRYRNWFAIRGGDA